MSTVFADTFYWAALLSGDDPYHHQAVSVGRRLAKVRIVTTDSVLTEFLTYASAAGPPARIAAAERVHFLLSDEQIEVAPETRSAFLAGLSLYSSRPDKQYSGVDCISMALMRERRITDVLTHDHHFTQEGFTVLL